MATPNDDPRSSGILIIGAGLFGLTTALELSRREYQQITILDRHRPPVVDGSSVDISRIIRTEYADPLYARMAQEAYSAWTTSPELSPYYHESGFVMLSNRDEAGESYAERSNEVSSSLGSHITVHEDARALKGTYPNIRADRFEGLRAYVNSRGGWADAGASIGRLAKLCEGAGVEFITGARGTVTSLVQAGGGNNGGQKITGVKVLAAGEVIPGSRVILATGAWTNRLVQVEHATSASGQPVGLIQLTPPEAASLSGTPVIINLSTGVFCFPPTPGTNILKIARHGYGFATKVVVDGSHGSDGEREKRTVSSPKRDGNNAAASYLPDDAEEALRDGLRQLLPDFAGHGWMNRRLCWYSDTQEGDFVIDHHPTIEGLFLATGGAGHAFKFLPVIGRYVADCYEDKAPEELRRKWRLKSATKGAGGVGMKGDGSRGGPGLRVLSDEERSKL